MPPRISLGHNRQEANGVRTTTLGIRQTGRVQVGGESRKRLPQGSSPGRHSMRAVGNLGRAQDTFSAPLVGTSLLRRAIMLGPGEGATIRGPQKTGTACGKIPPHGTVTVMVISQKAVVIVGSNLGGF